MGPGPALLLLGLGLGLGCGPGRWPPPPAPAQAPGSPARGLPVPTPASARPAPSDTRALVQARRPEAALRSVTAPRAPGERGAGFGGLGAGRARVSLRARAAPGGGIFLSGRRGLCLPAGRPPSLAPRCLRAHVQVRARRAAANAAPAPAPAPVDLQLSAPGGRLSLRWLSRLPRSLGPLEWTFRLGLLGPAAAQSRALPRRALPRGRRSYPGFVARTECPTDRPTPVFLVAVGPNSSEPTESSVSCQVSGPMTCKLDPVRINRNDDKPVRLTRDMGDTFNATVILFCPVQEYYLRMWYIYPVPYVGAVPDWTKPMQKPPVKVNLYATVRPPSDVKSSTTVLEELSNFTTGPNSSLSALLQQQDFLNASYLIYVVASVMNSMKTDTSLQADKIKLREHLFNQTLILPINTLVNISQVVMTITKLTEKTSEISAFSQKLATVRTWQASQALQDSHQRDKSISSEQIESVCTGILTTLSNILKLLVHYEVFEEPFHVVESLADTVLAVKVPENETTALRTSNFKMHVKKTEKWNVTKFFSTQKHCQNCFYPTLNVNSVASLPANAPISTMFCEFADDPFPWLNHGENILTQVVGFRMTGVEVTGDVIEMPPDAVEVYLIRKNLSFGTFNLTVGPSSEPYAADESLAKTTGAFSFVVDSAEGRDVLIHILTDVSVLFTVSVYAGREITPKSFMTSYLVPHKIPPIANESDLFDPECPVKEARVVCLPAALVQVIAQRTDSSECTIAVVLQAPRFVINPNNKLVRISVFSTECLDMLGIQSDWREDTCVVGEKTTWQRVHCMCKNPRRAKRQLDIIKQANLRLRTHYLTANVIVVPNPVDLRVEAVKNVTQNPVTLFTVLLIMLLYLILAFWALHRDETDQYLREHVIVLLDNDPDDNVCYLVTVFTGSRCGSGTRANVFIQLHGTEVSSFFIIFYGLTYGFEKSTAWLFASFCAFTQSVFLVQPSKVILVSGYRTRRAKYCKNLSWIGNSRFTEIKLHNIRKDPEEMDRRHRYVMELRNSRMYQPLTQDEITIFKRKKRIKRRAFLFLSYILTHFIFLALLLSLVAVLRPTDSFYYNQFIRDQFSVDLAGVARLEDIYQWLNRVLLPLLHNDPNPTFFPDSSSKILGLPLMRQLRAQPGEITCLPAKKFVAGSLKGEIRCHPEYGIDPEDTKNYSGSWNRVSKRDTDQTAGGFTYRPPEKRWAYSSYGLLHTYGSGGYAFYFFPAEQQFNSTLRLSKLQKGHWLDEKTWSVIVELTTFNADISLLCSVSVIFEVSQLGVVNTSLHAHSFSLAHFNRKYSADSAENYLYLAIFIFFLAYTVDEVYVITQERTAYVQSVYNLLNFALKCIFTLWIVLFFRKHFLAISVVRAYLSNPEDFIPFHAVAQVDYTMRVILGFLVFLTILKTLRYSRVFYDVRLAQRAIQIALPGICHMALVVSVYFFVFMAFGYLVFGQHEWNYSDMIHATQTIFSYCVSAFKNTEFFNNRVLGVLFLSSFLLVMICILINLFQAVILSAYEEMKQPVYEEPSEEAEAMTYLCHRLRSAFCCLCFKPRAEDEPRFFINMVYGQPEKKSRRYLGLKTRNINGKKMVYLVV
ncbi:hypothetical protein R6Z07M_005514 [Ovis aries]